ncbi:TPA: hypothetical protein DCW54_03340 [Candidatus Dependentiae bacterium]|nr:hypothetical protein [Candidatus Dependentiae bacterium]
MKRLFFLAHQPIARLFLFVMLSTALVSISTIIHAEDPQPTPVPDGRNFEHEALKQFFNETADNQEDTLTTSQKKLKPNLVAKNLFDNISYNPLSWRHLITNTYHNVQTYKQLSHDKRLLREKDKKKLGLTNQPLLEQIHTQSRTHVLPGAHTAAQVGYYIPTAAGKSLIKGFPQHFLLWGLCGLALMQASKKFYTASSAVGPQVLRFLSPEQVAHASQSTLTTSRNLFDNLHRIGAYVSSELAVTYDVLVND